ncbi:MAG: hypothetical protein Q4G71_11725 [Pseudomonadota bacterium]|nr:hypothetical protein [Pseudomonadota bacterium]
MNTLRLIAPAALLAAAFSVHAQTPPATGAAPAAPGTEGAPLRDETALDRRTQRVENITHEDAGSRVDEVRAGGETRSITVQPKAPVPAYDVLPANPGGPAQREGGPGSTGPRVWKIPF